MSTFLPLIIVSLLSLTNSIPIGRILHVSDIHLDVNYYPGSADNCSIGTRLGPGCCRKYEIDMRPYKPCSPWGDYNCDNSEKMVDNIFHWISDNIPGIDYVFYTGDSPGHHVITQSIHHNLESINKINKIIYKYFPKTPIYQSMGNHDTYPIDQTEDIIYRRFIDNISYWWNKSLPASSMRNVNIGGYYSVYLKEKVKLISFNSIYYDSINLFRVKDDSMEYRTGFQWKWFENELITSSEKGDKIIIINHIQPGSGEASEYYTQKLTRLITKYQQNIILNLYGHTHEDRFILYNTTGKITGVGLVPGSLMTSNHDPDFRIYLYNKSDFSIVDYMQYSCPLQSIIKTDIIYCNNTYNFSQEYELDGITLPSFQKLYNLLNTDDDILYKYRVHYWPGKITSKSCDQKCRNYFLDEIVV